MTNIFALTTRGLENVSASEIASLPDVTLTGTAYRRITAACNGSLVPLLGLRTVDDAYLELATWEGIRHTREMLAALQWYAARLELETAVETISGLRPLPAEPVFSITASFVGRRNYSTDEIKQTVSQGIRSEYGWQYSPDDRAADLNVRIFIEHEQAYIGVRLGKHPLHERSYKVTERPGSLKPPVAAAMLRLADVEANQTLLDSCCGSGTILIEAALIGVTAQGGDSDAEAVEAARANAQAADVTVNIERWDACALPLPNGSIERVVSNLPWGRQVMADENLYRGVCAEIERVLAAGGKAALLTSTPEHLHFERLVLSGAIEISLYGQTPTITLLDAK